MGDPTGLSIEVDREEDGRWIAEVPALPGALSYGSTREEAVASVTELALRIAADRGEHGEEWEAEIDRRIEDVRSGKVKLIPYEEVAAKLRAKYGWD